MLSLSRWNLSLIIYHLQIPFSLLWNKNVFILGQSLLRVRCCKQFTPDSRSGPCSAPRWLDPSSVNTTMDRAAFSGFFIRVQFAFKIKHAAPLYDTKKLHRISAKYQRKSEQYYHWQEHNHWCWRLV